MRNEVEFKNEVFTRLEKIKHKRKVRKRIILSVIPLLFTISVIGAVSLFGGGYTANEEDADGGAVGEIFELEASGNKNKNDTENDKLATGGSVTADNCTISEDEAVSSDIIYSDKAKIDGFKAFLGEFSDVVVAEGTAFKATGTKVTLIIGDKTEKYIITNREIYTEDMQKYQVIDEKKSKEIENYLKKNKSDK